MLINHTLVWHKPQTSIGRLVRLELTTVVIIYKTVLLAIRHNASTLLSGKWPNVLLAKDYDLGFSKWIEGASALYQFLLE